MKKKPGKYGWGAIGIGLKETGLVTGVLVCEVCCHVHLSL